MAKKTLTNDLKGVIEPTYTPTKEQVKQLTDLSSTLYDVKEALANLEGEDNISTIMFNIGSAYAAVREVEDQLDKLADLLHELGKINFVYSFHENISNTPRRP